MDWSKSLRDGPLVDVIQVHGNLLNIGYGDNNGD